MTGEPIQDNDLFKYDSDTDSIIKKHDLINDTEHQTELFEADPLDGGDWSGVGAGSFFEKDGIYYLSFRRRKPTDRGYKYELWTSSDLYNWTQLWEVLTSDMDVSSVEGSSIWYDGAYWYFYFSADWGTGNDWRIHYIKSSTVCGLASLLADNTQWNQVFTNHKDPRLMYWNGTYYMLARNTDGYEVLYSASTLDTTSWSSVYDFSSIEPANSHVGIILYDSSSSKFIYWGVGKRTYHFHWWAISDDLSSWTYVEKEDYTDKHLWYPYYNAPTSQTIYIISSFSFDDNTAPLYLWDYGPQATSLTLTVTKV